MKTDELLRRIALSDERTIQSAIGADTSLGETRSLEPKTLALVRLAGLLSVGATAESCRVTVEHARLAGATDEECVAVLVAVGPAVGAARLVSAAPQLALALDLEGCDDRWHDAGD